MNWLNESLSRGTGIISSLNISPRVWHLVSLVATRLSDLFMNCWMKFSEWMSTSLDVSYCYDEWCSVSQSPYVHKIHSEKEGFLSHGICSRVSGMRPKKNNVYLHTLVLGTSSPHPETPGKDHYPAKALHFLSPPPPPPGRPLLKKTKRK